MERDQTTQSMTAESITATIVERVATREGVEPTSLPPLHGVVDPDALTAVFAPTNRGDSRTDGRVEFTYCGHDVVVRCDGRVRVGDAEAE